MQVNAMNKAQMMILESFVGAHDEQELNAFDGFAAQLCLDFEKMTFVELFKPRCNL